MQQGRLCDKIKIMNISEVLYMKLGTMVHLGENVVEKIKDVKKYEFEKEKEKWICGI